MKNKWIYKGTAVLVTLSLGWGVLLPYHYHEVHGEEVKATAGVTLEKKDTDLIFGNHFLKRTFTITNGKLQTKELTNNRTGSQKKLRPASSEEFIIRTLENGLTQNAFQPPHDKLATNQWKITSDSEATNEGQNGPASKMFDGDINTYYHSRYGQGVNETEHQYPHNIYIDFQEEQAFQSLHYKQRIHNGKPTVSGHVKNFKLYIASGIDELKGQTNPVFTGTFDDKEDTYLNLEKEIKTRYVRIEFTDSYDPHDSQVDRQVACCSEFEFFKDKAVFPKNEVNDIYASGLMIKGEPILNPIENGKSLTFIFQPVVARGVTYNIQEVFTMKTNDPFMRKHLVIQVDAKDASKAKIDSIDLENMDFQEEDASVHGELGNKTQNYWTIPELKNNPDMANMKGDYLELGQPYYVGAMYWGCEFPQTENKIRVNTKTMKQNGFIRYHYGKNLEIDHDFNSYNNYNGANNQSGVMVTWDAVCGSARSSDYSVVQSDFYDYIETIATPTTFRQQFNSWYDNMKNINSENIKNSFSEIEKGFTQHGLEPLDSYVVDDGWVNYQSFWDFDRSQNKFPNELYDSSLQVKRMGSSFGLWLGPRGGYGTERTIANWIQRNGLGSVNEQSGGDINISDARYLNKLRQDIFLNYQKKFDINYWKLDGMLLNPSTQANEHHVVGNPYYTISETYERWTDIYEDMRAQRTQEGKDLWINMTSYTNPSPWHLQWVNSVWMQNTGDSGFNYKFNATDEEAMLTYRDGDYYDFFNENQWQLPNKYFYNHDPVYAKTAHSAPGGRHLIHYTTEELRHHLYMLGTRGTAFWEYYYSPSMFDEEKWQVNAEASKWIKDNFDILQRSKMFGGDPEYGHVYGYSCWKGQEGIVSLRNPKNVEQSYTLTYDRLIGVSEDLKNVSGKVVIGDINKYQNNQTLSYGDQITFTLKPQEILIMQYGPKDNKPAAIQTVHGDKKEVDVVFDERIRTPNINQFKVEGYDVDAVKLLADLRTVRLSLNKPLKDLDTLHVYVNGVEDVVGNISKTDKIDDYYENSIVTSIVNRTLDGTHINKGNQYTVQGNDGMSIVGKIQTLSKSATIVQQQDAYSLSIDENGYLVFSMNGVSVNSQYNSKTRESDGSVTTHVKGMLSDGKEHTFAAVREINGSLKLYIDGELVNSVYSPTLAHFNMPKGEIHFAQDLVGKASYVTVLDRPLAYDEVTRFVDEKDVTGNISLRKNNKDVKVSAFDVTKNKAVSEKSDRPFSHINDGIKQYQANYLELNDTDDGKRHSRYIELDLGNLTTIEKMHMIRYADGRTYGPTVISVSKDKDFQSPVIVYNSDQTGKVHQLGQGKDALYQERAEGKTITLDQPVQARYIRIYVNGNENGSTSDHIVEFEVYGTKQGKEGQSLYRMDYSILEPLVNEDMGTNYTKTSLLAYSKQAQPALDKAKKLLDERNAQSDQEIDHLVLAIKKARELLVEHADTKKAKHLLQEAEKLQQKDYTTDSWKAFIQAQKRLDNAVNDPSDIMQTEMDDLIKAFNTAKDGLVKQSLQESDHITNNDAIKDQTQETSDHITNNDVIKDQTHEENNISQEVKSQHSIETSDRTNISLSLILCLFAIIGLRALMKRKN